MLNNLTVLDFKTPQVLELTTTLEDLPLDNYRVQGDVITETVEKELLQNPNRLGIFVLDHYRVMGVMSRLQFFEQLSKQFSRDLYSSRPIKIMVEKCEDQLLKLPISTTIAEAVEQALSRSAKYFYEPIVVVKNGKELGMLDLSTLILAQSKMFATINNKLIEQEKELRNYADKIEQEKQKVNDYAQRLELQQRELQERNEQLEQQSRKFKHRNDELSAKTTSISSLNQKITNVSVVLSLESKKTFSALKKSINSLTLFNQKIQDIANNIQTKLLLIDEANTVINKIGKRVENLSFQMSVLGIYFAANSDKGRQLASISEEIKTMAVLNSEASISINNIAKELKPQIKLLVNTTLENQEITTTLELQSESTQLILNKISYLVAQKEENESN